MSIPGYGQWIKDTSANVLTPRSSRLKAVDDAIQQYEKTKSEKDLWRILENLHKHGFEEIYKSSIDLIEKPPWEIQGLPKRPKRTSAGIFTEVKRIFSTVSPLGDLKDLKDLSS